MGAAARRAGRAWVLCCRSGWAACSRGTLAGQPAWGPQTAVHPGSSALRPLLHPDPSLPPAAPLPTGGRALRHLQRLLCGQHPAGAAQERCEAAAEHAAARPAAIPRRPSPPLAAPHHPRTPGVDPSGVIAVFSDEPITKASLKLTEQQYKKSYYGARRLLRCAAVSRGQSRRGLWLQRRPLLCGRRRSHLPGGM